MELKTSHFCNSNLAVNTVLQTTNTSNKSKMDKAVKKLTITIDNQYKKRFYEKIISFCALTSITEILG